MGKHKKKKPEIRFKGFTDDWEQRKLGWLVDNDVIEAPKDGNHGEKHPTSDEYVEKGIPFLMASDIHNGRVDLENCKYITKERAKRLDKGFAREGDVLLTHKATIGEVAILEGLQEEYAMLTPQVTYYRILDNKRLSHKYLYAVFHSESFQNEMQTKAAQSTRPYIGISAQQNLTISLPCSTKEQQRIGEYFASLDTFITLHQRKLNKLKKVKKSMLEKMFPQNGEIEPQIRFCGFNSTWEQRKLGEIVNFYNGDRSSRYPNDDDIVSDGLPFINAGDLVLGSVKLDTANKITEKKYNELSGAKIKYGDIIYCLRGSIGKSAFVDNFNAGTIASSLVDIRPKKIEGQYLFQVLNSNIEYQQRTVNDEGAAQPNMSVQNLSLFDIPMPSRGEQNKIALCFYNLDNLITLHQRKLEKLKKIKKAMLEKMFV